MATHHRWRYDVFVSFRGEDIRKGFMDHLFNHFNRKGIIAFRDDTHLPRGENISPQLYKAIENSRFLIVIFSKNYASSSWCLKELVAILECKHMINRNYQVQIVFYDVKPDVVRKQTESYAKAFTKHESLKKKEVLKWKEALTIAANLSGWDLQDMADGYESKFIDMISNDILQKLCVGPLDVGETLVGIDAHLSKMNLPRFIGSTKVHMIGICGIGGIGKTTLAKVIYNLMHMHFETYNFCEDVQEVVKQQGLLHVLMHFIGGTIKSRNQMITSVCQGTKVMKKIVAHKRILIVLDAIDHRNQLEALAGSSSWFMPGSLIVVTSKDKQLLNAHGIDEIYDVDFLLDNEALRLFSLYAFRDEHPTEDFKELANQFVQYVQGHPLTLKVLGSFLFGKTLRQWKSELDKLQVYPNPEIQRLSFDGLDENQKNVFLDIACSLKGEGEDLAVDVLNSCNSFADTNIRVLVDRSLVTISRNKELQMHDLVQRMSWEILRQEFERSGKWSRLWIREEVCDLLHKDEIIDAVEVLVLMLDMSCQKIQINSKAFSWMKKLRILKICDSELGNIGSRLEFSGAIDFLSNELRLLYWHGYPFKFLPSSFYPKSIVVIDMSYSNITNLWTTPKSFEKLKVMKLRHCRGLAHTPDFAKAKNLEELNLEGCIKLVDLHPSIGTLKRLIILNLRNCRSLRNFPSNIETESLQVLVISGCLKVDKLPEALGKINTMVELRIDRTAIKEIPSLVLSLSNLQVFSIGGRADIQSRWQNSRFWPPSFLRKNQHPTGLVLPSLAGLRLLRHLDVSHCNISEISPDSIGGLSCLEHLNLSGNNFTSCASLSGLSQLTMLGLVGCKNLKVLPELPPNIKFFDAIDCTSLQELQMQQVMYSNERLCLDFTNCPKLVENHTIESLVFMLLPQSPNPLWSRLHILLQGNRIPKWFTHRSVGNFVEVKVPPHWCSNKFMRYGTCVVFRANIFYINKDTILDYHVKNSDGVTLDYVYLYPGTNFSSDNIRVVGSDMIWLHYSKLKPGPKEVNTFITFIFSSSQDVELKECSVRFFCDEDIPEASGLSMIEGIPTPTPTQDGAPSNSNNVRISEIIEDEPPFKKIRMV